MSVEHVGLGTFMLALAGVVFDWAWKPHLVTLAMVLLTFVAVRRLRQP